MTLMCLSLGLGIARGVTGEKAWIEGENKVAKWVTRNAGCLKFLLHSRGEEAAVRADLVEEIEEEPKEPDEDSEGDLELESEHRGGEGLGGEEPSGLTETEGLDPTKGGKMPT